jgi:hypothetical protein
MEFGASLLDHPRRGFAAVALLSPLRERLSGVMWAMVELSDLYTVIVEQIAVNATIKRRQIRFGVQTSTNARLVGNNDQNIPS